MVFAEALRSIRASMSTTVAATMTVLIGMFILGLAVGLGTWVLSYSNKVKEEIVVHAYFCTPGEGHCTREATARQINKTRAYLLRMPEVKSLKFVSKNDALRIVKKKAYTAELVAALPYNPLPAKFEITPRRADDAAKIASRLNRAVPPGLEHATAGGETTRRVLKVGKIVESIFLVGVILLLIASTLLIANTIRLSIFARRREIEVMKLVGATNWFVRGPFMIEGLMCGLIGSVTAILLLFLGKEWVWPAILPKIDNAPGGDEAQAIPFALNALVILGVGLLLGALGSALTLRRFLKV